MQGEWVTYDFPCPDCGTQVMLSVFYRTDRDDGGWRNTNCTPDNHKAAQPMGVDKRSDNPKLICNGKPEQA